MVEHPKKEIEQIGPATIYKNFLEESCFREIKAGFVGPYVPWSYSKNIIKAEKDEVEEPDTFQFTHNIFSNAQIMSQPGFELIKPIVSKIDPVILFRVKANLGTRNGQHTIGGFHVDTHEICTTSIFYLNENNGYTMFEDGTKIPSTENTLVCFDSAIKHTGVSQTDAQVRIVLNLNYIPKN